MGLRHKLSKRSSLEDEDYYLVPVKSKAILNKALLSAVSEGLDDRVTSLTEAGADANVNDPSGESALLIAVTNEHVKCVECLLTSGADVNR